MSSPLACAWKLLTACLCLCCVCGQVSDRINPPPNGNLANPFFPNRPGPQSTYMGDMETFREQLMYPYDLHDQMDITSSKPIHDQSLPFRLPFFGFHYNYLWIQRDGYMAFNKGLQQYKWPIKFPAKPRDPTIEEDPSMIAPWFALQDIASDIQYAGVYFRIIQIQAEQNITLRDRIILDFKEGMIGAATFDPKFAIIITWRNMTMGNRRTDRALKTNTYQCVLATDEMRTYVMFNYEQIDWITHEDTYDGLKGTSAFIGFNAGNTTRTFEFRPYSQNPRISMMEKHGFGNGLEGRFFFQIDEEVWPGACIDKDLDPNLPDRLPLTFFPRYGHMLGGTLVNITGPCFKKTSIIICKFENWKTEGFYQDTNHATCISPPVMYHGYIDLTVSVDDRTLFLGRFYLQPPDIADEDVVILQNVDRLEQADEMTLKWQMHKLSWESSIATNIALWGYRETNDIYPSLTFIDNLDTVSQRGNQFTMDLTKFRDRINRGKIDITFGFIGINLTDVSKMKIKTSPIIWSRPMPLAWYFKPQWEWQYGSNGKWKEHFCDEWYEREQYADRFATTNFRCPCTLDQAKLDLGRFAPDQSCNVIDKKCDTFHRGAQDCFKTARPSIGGSGQACCYDDWGELLQTADTMYGGRPSRAISYGKHPFKMRMMIPSLSNWLTDVMPFFFCCKWQPNEDNAPTCQKYNHWRASQDCSSYQSPAVASLYGDPHFYTFDGVNYTFNGRGEFSLVHVDNAVHKLDVQARFERVPRKLRTDQLINATQLMAVAAKDNQSSVVEFRIRPEAARWRYQIYVIVDKEYVYFWDDSWRVQNFKGVTLYQPAGITNMSQIIAMFDSGAGVEVLSTDGHMTVHTYAPVTFLNGTSGLFGYYDRKKENDLARPNKNPENNYLNQPSSIERIHKEFGRHWRVVEGLYKDFVGISLFHHDPVSFAEYDDPNFEPHYDVPMMTFDQQYLEDEMNAICSDSPHCRYDYMITGDKEFAKVTKKHESWAYTLGVDGFAREVIIRCPALQKPMNGRKSENRYWPGTIVRFACDDGYRLTGYEIRKCREDGLWSWGVDPECISTGYYGGQMAGISIGIIFPILLILVCTVFCVIYQRRNGGERHYTHEPGTQPAFSEWTPKGFQPVPTKGDPSTLPMTGRPIAEIKTNAVEADC